MNTILLKQLLLISLIYQFVYSDGLPDLEQQQQEFETQMREIFDRLDYNREGFLYKYNYQLFLKTIYLDGDETETMSLNDKMAIYAAIERFVNTKPKNAEIFFEDAVRDMQQNKIYITMLQMMKESESELSDDQLDQLDELEKQQELEKKKYIEEINKMKINKQDEDETIEEYLIDSFRQFDDKGKGYLSIYEFESLLRKLYIQDKPKKTLNSNQQQTIIKAIYRYVKSLEKTKFFLDDIEQCVLQDHIYKKENNLLVRQVLPENIEKDIEIISPYINNEIDPTTSQSRGNIKDTDYTKKDDL